jgi:hypothetical protein
VALRPPGRTRLRLAGVLTQLIGGSCLLIGTISLVLAQQNLPGGIVVGAAWLAVALVGLVFGGLIYRGGLIPMIIAATLDAGLGAALIALDDGTLRTLLKILPAGDVATIGVALNIAGGAMIGVAAYCLAVVPLGVRYARWFRGAVAADAAEATVVPRRAPPAPITVRTYISSPGHPRARRRLYVVLGGLAVGAGIGAGALMSWITPGATPTPAASAVQVTPAPAAPVALTVPVVAPPAADSDAPVADTVQRLIGAQHAAIANADRVALAGYLSPRVFGFGVDAEEIADGRDAVAAQLVHDLGEPPAGGFTLQSRTLAIGELRNHAWISEELEVAAAGHATRRFAITELAVALDGRWLVVALHWATPVDDATAERRAILGTLPVVIPIPDRHDGTGELDQAVRAAFASRTAFAGARSGRPDAFNLGSGGERAHGGDAIKRLFTKLKAQIRIHDGVRVVAGSAWDPAQRSDPWIGWAAVNVDFTSKTRAATEVTQTFRVLAILIKEDASWKLVQTQWSNGGPIR